MEKEDRLSKIINVMNERVSMPKLFIFVIKIYWKNNKLLTISLILLVIISVGFSFINSWAFAQLLNSVVSPDKSWNLVLSYFVLLISMDILPGVTGYFETAIHYYLDRVLKIEIEDKIFRKLATLDISVIENPDFQNYKTQINSRGISSFINISNCFFSLIRQISRIVISVGVMLSISAISAVVLTVFTLPVYFLESIRSKRLARLWENQSESNRKLNMKLGSYYNKNALIELKIFNSFKFFRDKIRNIRLNQHQEDTNHDKKNFGISMASNIVPDIGMVYVLVNVIRRILAGTEKIGQLSFVWSTLFQFQTGLINILRSIGRLEENSIHASKIIRLLELQSYIDENKNGIKVDINVPPKIELKNISFSYPNNDSLILKNLNLTIDPGQEIAIVGLNGAGKTTLIKLIGRAYDPTEGEILINGVNLKEYNLRSWQNSISAMFQEYSVYSDESLRQNITMSETNIDIKKSEVSARDSLVLDFADKFKDKLDQMVGNEFKGGVELSKGQKQKVALARSLYHDRSILILDEPTSAIDAISEDSIFKTIRENYKDKTRILISHKFSNVRSADKIILLEDGQIVEMGTHQELISQAGKYKELFELQAKGYE